MSDQRDDDYMRGYRAAYASMAVRCAGELGGGDPTARLAFLEAERVRTDADDAPEEASSREFSGEQIEAERTKLAAGSARVAEEEQRLAMVESLRRLVTAWRAKEERMDRRAKDVNLTELTRDRAAGEASAFDSCARDLCALAGIEAPSGASAHGPAIPSVLWSFGRAETPADRAQQSGTLKAAELARGWLRPRLNMLNRLVHPEGLTAEQLIRAKAVGRTWHAATRAVCEAFGIPEPQPDPAEPGADHARYLLEREADILGLAAVMATATPSPAKLSSSERYALRRGGWAHGPQDGRWTRPVGESQRALFESDPHELADLRHAAARIIRAQGPEEAPPNPKPTGALDAFAAWFRADGDAVMGAARDHAPDVARGAFLAGWTARGEMEARRPDAATASSLALEVVVAHHDIPDSTRGMLRARFADLFRAWGFAATERRPRDPEAIARLDALFAAAPPEWQELFAELDRRDPKMQATVDALRCLAARLEGASNLCVAAAADQAAPGEWRWKDGGEARGLYVAANEIRRVIGDPVGEGATLTDDLASLSAYVKTVDASAPPVEKASPAPPDAEPAPPVKGVHLAPGCGADSGAYGRSPVCTAHADGHHLATGLSGRVYRRWPIEPTSAPRSGWWAMAPRRRALLMSWLGSQAPGLGLDAGEAADVRYDARALLFVGASHWWEQPASHRRAFVAWLEAQLPTVDGEELSPGLVGAACDLLRGASPAGDATHPNAQLGALEEALAKAKAVLHEAATHTAGPSPGARPRLWPIDATNAPLAERIAGAIASAGHSPDHRAMGAAFKAMEVVEGWMQSKA